MKNLWLTAALTVCVVTGAAHAETIKEIFESIANTAVTGNGNGHYVNETDPKKFDLEKEIRELNKEVNAEDDSSQNSCRYDIQSGIEDGIATIEDNWSDSRTANRLRGMAAAGMIREIVYSDWDPNTGDSEYCLMSTLKVYAVDGTVLVMDFNETD